MLTLGDLKPIEAPSGQLITLTPEEEADIVRSAVSERIRSRMNMDIEVRSSAISAIGNAVGFAVGGFLVGLILKQAR